MFSRNGHRRELARTMNCLFPQFALRSLLLFVLALSTLLGAVHNCARRQREGVRAIRRMGGTVMYDLVPSRSRGWFLPLSLRPSCGSLVYDVVYRVVCVGIYDITRRDVDNFVLALRSLPDVELLVVYGETMSDADLACLPAMPRLHSVILGCPNVSTIAMARLKATHGCSVLGICDQLEREKAQQPVQGN